MGFTSSPLANPEDNKLSGSKGRNADQTDQATVVQIVLCHRGAIAFYPEGLLRLISHIRAALKFVQQEILNHSPHIAPQLFAIRFKLGKLRSSIYLTLKPGEVTLRPM